MAERQSTVRVRARAAARVRTAAVRATRRARDERIDELVAAHAEDMALADAVRVRAELEMATHLRSADQRVLRLTGEMGETVAAVAELLGMEPSAVRAALKRARKAASGADGAAEGPEGAPPAAGTVGVDLEEVVGEPATV